MLDRFTVMLRRLVDRRAESAKSSLDRPHVDFAVPGMQRFIADTIREQAVYARGVEASTVYVRAPRNPIHGARLAHA